MDVSFRGGSFADAAIWTIDAGLKKNNTFTYDVLEVELKVEHRAFGNEVCSVPEAPLVGGLGDTFLAHLDEVAGDEAEGSGHGEGVVECVQDGVLVAEHVLAGEGVSRDVDELLDARRVDLLVLGGNDERHHSHQLHALALDGLHRKKSVKHVHRQEERLGCHLEAVATLNNPVQADGTHVCCQLGLCRHVILGDKDLVLVLEAVGVNGVDVVAAFDGTACGVSRLDGAAAHQRAHSAACGVVPCDVRDACLLSSKSHRHIPVQCRQHRPALSTRLRHIYWGRKRRGKKYGVCEGFCTTLNSRGGGEGGGFLCTEKNLGCI